MPKISAPVQKFHVNRGDHVKQGQLLAELENRDLRPRRPKARASWTRPRPTTAPPPARPFPKRSVKAQTDVQAAKRTADAARKLLESRQKLFKEGALARKLVDEAQVAYAQAKSQYETAQEHLRSAAERRQGGTDQSRGQAQVEAAKGQYQSAQAQVAYSEIRSPITGVVADRPLYPGEMANAGTPLLTVMDISTRGRARQYSAGPGGVRQGRQRRPP